MALECRDATFILWGLSDIEDAIEKLRGQSPAWLRPSLLVSNDRHLDSSSRSPPFAVHMPMTELDAKHATAFNHARFYIPEILNARSENNGNEDNFLLLLDDDVIVQRDVLGLTSSGVSSRVTGADHDKVIGAGCSHWVLSKDAKEMEYTTEASYLNVPYFGFGAITPRRSVEDAECVSSGQIHCIPPGLISHLGDLSYQIDSLTTQNSRLTQPLFDGAHQSFAESLERSRAWNFGFVLVDLSAWTNFRVTDRYELWLEANARDQIWPSNSLAFGLGLPFLALRGFVQCFEHDYGEDAKRSQEYSIGGKYGRLSFEQGLGIMPWSTMKGAGKRIADLDAAFALHFNGDKKPWDAMRCVGPLNLSPTEQRFASYAEMSAPFSRNERGDSDETFCRKWLSSPEGNLRRLSYPRTVTWELSFEIAVTNSYGIDGLDIEGIIASALRLLLNIVCDTEDHVDREAK